jgi:hypothetical protein
VPGQLREIRRRIKSVQSTAKITRAMELVAASKMRRAQLNALAGRPYAEKMRWVLADLAETLPLMDPETVHPLLQKREETKAVEYLRDAEPRPSGGLPDIAEPRGVFIAVVGVPVRVIASARRPGLVRRTDRTRCRIPTRRLPGTRTSAHRAHRHPDFTEGKYTCTSCIPNS